jgi:hypothetical protein
MRIKSVAWVVIFTVCSPGGPSTDACGPVWSPRVEPVDGGLPPFDFSVSEIAWIDDRTLAVVDPDEDTAIMYDVFSQRRLRSVGRSGGGPGEFTLVEGLLPHPDSGVVMVGGARATWFSDTGADLATVAIPGIADAVLRAEPHRTLVAYLVPGLGRHTVGWVDFDLDTVIPLFSPMEMDEGLRVPAPMGIPFVFFGFAALPDGDVVVGHPWTYRLIRFSPAGAVRHVFGREGLPVEKRTDAEREHLRDRILRMFAARGETVAATAAPVVDQMLAQPKPHIGVSLQADGQGRVWVITQRFVPDSTMLDVFDASGAYAGSVTLADRVMDLAFEAANMAVLVEIQSGPAEGQYAVRLFRVESSACPDAETISRRHP